MNNKEELWGEDISRSLFYFSFIYINLARMGGNYMSWILVISLYQMTPITQEFRSFISCKKVMNEIIEMSEKTGHANYFDIKCEAKK